MEKKPDLDKLERGMPEKNRLGEDDKGIVDVPKWEERFITFMTTAFGEFASWTTDLKMRPYMEVVPEFVYKKTVGEKDEETGRTIKKEIVLDVPKAKDAEAYEEYKDEKKRFYDRVEKFRTSALTQISVMLEGCMKKASIERFRRIHEKDITEIREDLDVIRLHKLMVEIHNYTGEITGEEDADKVKEEFTMWGAQKSYPEGATIQDYVELHRTILRKLKAFGLIGNKNKDKDWAKPDEIMRNFLSRMIYYPNSHIQDYCMDIKMKKDNLPNDMEAVIATLKNFVKHTPEEKVKKGGKYDGSVHTTKGGSVNSAHGSVTKNFNNKFKRQHADKPDFSKFPISERKFEEIAERDGQTKDEARRETKCNECRRTGHLKLECPNLVGDKKERGDKKHHHKKDGKKYSGDKKKFHKKTDKRFDKRKGKVHTTRGASSEESGSEDSSLDADSEDSDEESSSSDSDGTSSEQESGFVFTIKGAAEENGESDEDDIPDLISNSDSDSDEEVRRRP